MTITVNGPDGSSFNFPDGTSDDVIHGALSQHYGQQAPAAGPTTSDTAKDVLQSAGTGIAKGVGGLVGLPGDVETLARWGGRKLADYVTPPTPEQKAARGPIQSVLPTGSDVNKWAESLVGGYHQPTTTAGKYAETIGEFAPAALAGPGGIARRVVQQAVIPGAASELAGEVAKNVNPDWEPYARALGGIAGFASAGKLITPAASSAARQDAINTLTDIGVSRSNLTAGDITGSTGVQKVERAASEIPGVGQKSQEMKTRRALAEFTGGVMNRMGFAQRDTTGQSMAAIHNDLSNEFNRLTAGNNMQWTPTLHKEMRNALDDYTKTVNPNLASPLFAPAAGRPDIVNDALNQAIANGGFLTGRQYQTLRSQLSQKAANASDTAYAGTAAKLRNALDDAMENSIRLNNPGDLGAFDKARQQWRNKLILENAAAGPGPVAAGGVINPTSLKNSVKSIEGTADYVRGTSEIGRIARAGEEIFETRKHAYSGTPGITNLMHQFQLATALGGEHAGGILGGLAGWLGGAAGPALLARGIMSRPAQAYLANQVIPLGETAGRLSPRNIYAAQLMGNRVSPQITAPGQQPP